MDYFAAYHSSSTSSPAMSVSNESDSLSLDSLPQMDESQSNLDSLWLNDESALLWGLDISQDFAADFDPTVQTVTSNATTASASTAQSNQTGVEKKASVPATDKTSRRREQNRASQRLFRERKIHYIKGIEQQLEELNEKHQDLIVSFNNQTREKLVLLSQVAKLTAKLAGRD